MCCAVHVAPPPAKYLDQEDFLESALRGLLILNHRGHQAEVLMDVLLSGSTSRAAAPPAEAGLDKYSRHQYCYQV